MFEDSLVESAGKLRTNSKYTTLVSFVAQCTFIFILVLIPLIYTEALPTKTLLTSLVAPPPPPPPPPPPAQIVHVEKVQSDIVEGQLRQPTKIPNKIKQVVEDEPPAPAVSGAVGGVPGGVPGGQAGGVLGGVLSAANMNAPKVAPTKVRISQIQLGSPISAPHPLYPPIARQARVSGSVILAATISKSGTIENLKVVSGHPMLINSAVEAVKQWRYKPYVLNGEPVEVETQITVNFNMTGG
jgi:protein TonB